MLWLSLVLRKLVSRVLRKHTLAVCLVFCCETSQRPVLMTEALDLAARSKHFLERASNIFKSCKVVILPRAVRCALRFRAGTGSAYHTWSSLPSEREALNLVSAKEGPRVTVSLFLLGHGLA